MPSSSPASTAEVGDGLSVAWLGNLANVGFNYVRLLNGHGVDAALYLARNQLRAKASGNPEHEYPGAASEPFVRLHYRHYGHELANRLGYLGWPSRLDGRIARAHRIVQAQTCREIVALRINRRYGLPYVGLTTGSDLSEVAMGSSPLSRLYRRALADARHLFLVNTNQVDLIDRLPFEVSWSYLPLRVDLDSIQPARPRRRTRPRIYCMARLDWNRDSASIKGNDVFLRGYARFVRDHGSDHFDVWIRDWGPDREATRTLVRDLGLSEAVQFVATVDRPEFLDSVAEADIVVDQFSLGAVGLAALEAMASGRAVIAYCNQDWARRAYGEEVPVINCPNEEAVARQLAELRPDRLVSAGEQANAWVRQHHSAENVFQILRGTYARILDEPHSRGVA